MRTIRYRRLQVCDTCAGRKNTKTVCEGKCIESLTAITGHLAIFQMMQHRTFRTLRYFIVMRAAQSKFKKD